MDTYILPKRLYKFLHNERIDVLKNQQIRFTQPSALNDPFELKPLFEILFSSEQLDEILNPSFSLFEEALRKEYTKLTDQQRSQVPIEYVLSMVKSNPIILEESLRLIRPKIDQAIPMLSQAAKEMMYEVFNSNIGILSLTENLNNELMWAHYANSHRGYVIEFDSSHEFFNRRRTTKDEFFHLRKVAYLDRNEKDITLGDLNSDFFVTKSKAWEYEQEWRILAPLEQAAKKILIDSDSIYLFNYPISAITSVVIGAKSPSNFAEEIVKLLSGTHIAVKKVQFSGNAQQLMMIDI